MRRFIIAAAALLAACSSTDEPEEQQGSPEVVISPIQPRPGSKQDAPGVSTATDTSEPTSVCAATIPYQGGPVMTNTIKVYLVWYGNWSGNTAQTIIPDLIRSLGPSLRWKTDTTFTNGSGTPVSGAVQLGGQFNDAYSHGSTLSQAAVFQVVSRAINAGAFPADANGVYYVLTSADVSQTNSNGQTFCGNYCGWHSGQTFFVNGLFPVTIKYSFVGDGDRCPFQCISSHLDAGSPNNNRGADAMASVIVHELDETSTDPLINAWFAGSASAPCENADNCAWTFGGTWPSANGATANAHIGTRDFLIQRNWANFGTGFCTTSWPGTCNGTPGQWSGCRGTGCNVCAELVSNAPCYFRNHPNCNSNTTCGGSYFTCNANCPAPSGADFDCHRCGDGTCNTDETAASCPADCPQVCGDGFCGPGENCGNCPGDCGSCSCGTCADGSTCCGVNVCADGSFCI